MAMGENSKKEPMAEEPERFGDHPAPEELSAYQAGELSPDQFDEVQRHLAGCRLCTEVLLDLERFLDLPPEDRPREGVADLETEVEWLALRAKLGNLRLLTRDGARRTQRVVCAVAAIFLVAIGFSFYIISGNPKGLQTLEPLNSHRGRTVVAEIVKLPKTLLLKSPVKIPYPEYRAEILDLEGHSMREFSRLRETPSFDLEIPLRRGSLDPGEYRIRLFGDGQSKPVGEYAFKVVDR